IDFYLLFQASAKYLGFDGLSHDGFFGLDPDAASRETAGEVWDHLPCRIGNEPDQFVRSELSARSGAQTMAGRRDQAFVCINSVKLTTALRQTLHLACVLLVTAQTSAEASEEASCVSSSLSGTNSSAVIQPASTRADMIMSSASLRPTSKP